MKSVNEMLYLAVILIVIMSCEKNKIKAQPGSIATLIVTNSIVGGTTIKLNTNERDSAKSYNSKSFFLASGQSEINLYSTSGSKNSYYNNVQQIEGGGVYSIFLTGQGSSVDGLFVKENLPPYYSDSVFGVRVINLSPNSDPVNIALASSGGTNLFSNLTYKHITSISILPLRNPIPPGSVTFQIKNASTNTVLASYTLPGTANSTYPNISVLNSRNRNLTLVIKGLMGVTSGSDALGLFPVANY